VPSETNFVYMLTEKPVEVFEALLAEGIIVRDFGTAPALRWVSEPRDTNATIAALQAAVAKWAAVSSGPLGPRRRRECRPDQTDTRRKARYHAGSHAGPRVQESIDHVVEILHNHGAEAP